MTSAEGAVRDALKKADIEIGGSRPWDIQVHNDGLYSRILHEGNLGLGEAYMDGWWDCDQLDEFFVRVLRARLNDRANLTWPVIWGWLTGYFTNAGRRSKAFEVGERHYDAGNDLYEKMLDRRMTYTCGYWKYSKTLDEAQEAKLDLVCRKLDLKPGMKVLDIGCGWGSFLKFAAEKYGITGVGLTVSKEQAVLAENMVQGLPIEIKLQDYREVQGTFDRVVSLGMFEHVGYKNYRKFMEVVSRVLTPEGLVMLHTIGSNTSSRTGDAWLDKYIFPNGMLPSIAQIGRAIENLFYMEDWHNFGPDYYRTTLAWMKNIDAHWAELGPKYGDRFYRIWRYYLLSCGAAFKARHMQLWQIVLSPRGYTEEYKFLR